MAEHFPTDEDYLELQEEARNLESLLNPEKLLETNRILQAVERLFDERLFNGMMMTGDVMADLEILRLTGTALHESIDMIATIPGYSATRFADTLLNIFGTDENNELNWDKIIVNYFSERVVLPRWHGDNDSSIRRRDENPTDPSDFPGYLTQQMPRPPAQKSTDTAKEDVDKSPSDITTTKSNEVAEVNTATYLSDKDNFNLDSLFGSPATSKDDIPADTAVHIIKKDGVTDKTHITDASVICSAGVFESIDPITQELSHEKARREEETITQLTTRLDTSVHITSKDDGTDKTHITLRESTGAITKELSTDQKETKPTNVKVMQQVLDIIKGEYETRGALPFYELVCDPVSFETTADNILHVLSLVNDRYITMAPGENDQVVIKPIPADEKHSPEYAVFEDYESMFTLDKKTWENMVKVFKIESAIIRIPDRD